ncbi:hypothetical protein SLEP1_g24432 [Rubroshorea leprosula]|uniref:Uncharacterized protein n=1 Tax=Rubroshorea leprosula TaxID=152421 RepID=A0AAV5JLZ5_9ROSI|nr:hypothetical protein SLEP1_g24432 [Rubroshorea leprosula]
MLVIEPVRSTLLVGVIHQQIVCPPVGDRKRSVYSLRITPVGRWNF